VRGGKEWTAGPHFVARKANMRGKSRGIMGCTAAAECTRRASRLDGRNEASTGMQFLFAGHTALASGLDGLRESVIDFST